MEFDQYTFHHVPVIERTLSRFTTLVRGLEPQGGNSNARTKKAASQGRKPKIKTPRELSTPIFITNDKGALIMNSNLVLIAQALNMAERLA